MEPVLPGAKRLAEINRREVDRRFDAETDAEVARSESQRRARLFESGAAIFSSISQPLAETVEDEAPVAKTERGALRGKFVFDARLGGATLMVARPEQVQGWQGPFDVVAAAFIAVQMPANRNGWEGRSHSLWYCDAQSSGEYAWYEMAFMDSPFTPSSKSVEPYSVSPSQAGVAFSGVMGTMQLAWPVTAIDRDDPQEFIDRWIGWFADAVEGRLGRPSTMPERDPQGSWRRAR